FSERTSTSVPGSRSASNSSSISRSKASLPTGLIQSTLRLVPAPSSAIAPSEQDPEDLAVLLGLRAVRLAGGDVDDLARPDLPGHPAGVQRGRALEEDRHLVLRVHRL